MTARYLAIGSMALMAASAASSSVTMMSGHVRAANAIPGPALLYAVGGRSFEQRRSSSAGKMDSVLADLVRHAALARADHALSDLHALSPAARFARGASTGVPLVAVDAVTRGDPQALKSALQRLGLEHVAVYRNDVGGWLPVTRIEAAAARGEVVSIRAAMSHTRATGPVATQGDYVQESVAIRTSYPSLSGAGVTIGIISDSFNCYSVYAASGVPASGDEGYAYNGFTADYSADIASGALPSGIQILEEPTYTGDAACMGYQNPDSENQPTGLPFSDEGRAMAQIVYAIAPGAQLAFRTGAISEADFASGIETLASAPFNAKVIADDLGYYDEPFFQDGLVAQAIDAVKSKGVAYFSAAGNNQETPSYLNTSPSFGTLSNSAPNSGEYLLNFDVSGATTVTSLPVTIPALSPGDFVAVLVEWDQPYVTGAPDSGGASSQIDVCLTGATGSDVILNYDNTVTSCSGPNAVGSDSYQVMVIANPAVGSNNTEPTTIDIQIGLVNGTKAPGRILVAVEDDGQGSTINKFSPKGPTLQGHPGAAGAAAVGAAFYFYTPACGTTTATIEAYSASGGAPILFSSTGARLATPVVRQKPDFVGPDGVNDTFLGFTLASASPPYPANGLLTTSVTQCQNNPSYPNFFGTSAATPHAAAIAALMLQANDAATPDTIYGALRGSALAMPGIAGCGSAQPNLCSGYGFIQAQAAFATPVLSLSATAAIPGANVTLAWSTIDAVSCTASGGWSGAQQPNGSTILPASLTTGTETFGLMCTDSAGTTSSGSVILTVEPVPAAPKLTLGASSVAAGDSTTISWESSNATSCTASGSWSGTLASSGSKTITASSSAGTQTYSLACANAAGSSSASTASLAVTADPPSTGGGGGGALGGWTLAGLAALTAAARRSRSRTRAHRVRGTGAPGQGRPR